MFETRRRRSSEQIKVLSVAVFVDGNGYPVFTGFVGRIGVGQEQSRIVLREVVAAVDAVERAHVSSNYAVDLPTVHHAEKS